MPKQAEEKFTVQTIRATSGDDGLARDRYDADCPGLVLRVTGEHGSTRRTFYARYTVKGGKRGMMKLGDFPKLKLEAARELARKTIKIAHDGIDPRDARRAKQLAEKDEIHAILDAPTFRTFAETFVTRSKATRRRATWIEDERIANHCIMQFGGRPIGTIGPKAISDYLDGFITKARTKNQYRAVLLSVFDLAIEKQALDTANPVLSVKRSKIHKSTPNPLPDSELKIALKLLDEDSQTGQIARLHLYTGQRPAHEIAFMRLGEIDFNGALWRLPAERAKNHLQHEVPLSKQALRVLEKAKRKSEATKANDLLFPSSARKSPVPFTSYKKPFRKIRETAKENGATGTGEAGRPWVVYDFKDTLLTRLRGRFPYEVRQMIPNHQNQDVTARYEGDSDELARKIRDALEWWGNYCDELEDRKPKLQAVKGGKR